MNSDTPVACPFCLRPSDRIVISSELAFALLDAYPIADGHTLVVPKRHVASIYELGAAEQTALWQFVGRVRDLLIEKTAAESFNIGVNDGLAAGQTVPHAHIHVIPRRPGDVPDPRGGIRWIIADKAAYWTK